MSDPAGIRITDYNYSLPADRIAQFPLKERDGSKLLIHHQGRISEDIFSNVADYLSENSLLVFNDTKVIRARIYFSTPTGARVEIFCLEPVLPGPEIQAAFHQTGASTWKCLVGNLKRWKTGILVNEIIRDGGVNRLYAERISTDPEGNCLIAFRWDPPSKSFAEILDLAGLIPLPPYIHRPTESSDAQRYQTIYAANDGSVAAPTAGLHFTGPLLEKIAQKGIDCVKVTLHVGIGTFRPVSAEQIGDHVMHHEKLVVSRKTIEHLLKNPDRPVFAVGTTSARTLESLYWLGVRLIREGSGMPGAIPQWYPYQPEHADAIPVKHSLEALLHHLERNQLDEYSGETQLMIVPGYSFKILSGLITNFHMPQSTLLLLVAALVGENWKQAYAYALANGFRFLSYGDSCIFFIQGK